MLRIRKAQMEVLQDARRAVFEDALLRHCRRNGIGTGHNPDDETLLAALRRVIGQAAGYGLRREGQILRFLDVAHEIGAWPGSGSPVSWAEAILTDTELAPDLRLALVEHRVRNLQSGEGAA